MTKPITSLLILLFATPLGFAQESSTKKIDPDVVYGHKDGLALTMDAYHPKQPNGGAILFMVSGGWVSKWSPPAAGSRLFEPFLSEGFTIFAVRHGSSPRYAIPEIVDDIHKSVRFVRDNAKKFDVDPKRLGIMGMSAGGHLALMMGTTNSDIAAVVSLVPPTDLRVAVWEAPDSLPVYRNFPALNLPLNKAKKFSPLVHVTPDDAPSLVIMGGKDELVPPKHGEWIAKAFKEKEVKHELIILPDAGHGLDGFAVGGKVVKSAVGWFKTHLAKDAAD